MSSLKFMIKYRELTKSMQKEFLKLMLVLKLKRKLAIYII